MTHSQDIHTHSNTFVRKNMHTFVHTYIHTWIYVYMY